MTLYLSAGASRRFEQRRSPLWLTHIVTPFTLPLSRPVAFLEVGLTRLKAGLTLGAMIGFWLVAWLPLAAYCLIAMAAGSLRHPRQAPS